MVGPQSEQGCRHRTAHGPKRSGGQIEGCAGPVERSLHVAAAGVGGGQMGEGDGDEPRAAHRRQRGQGDVGVVRGGVVVPGGRGGDQPVVGDLYRVDGAGVLPTGCPPLLGRQRERLADRPVRDPGHLAGMPAGQGRDGPRLQRERGYRHRGAGGTALAVRDEPQRRPRLLLVQFDHSGDLPGVADG